MIIDAKKQFACLHEYLALHYGFLCHKCDHLRYELPVTAKNGESLVFFPLAFNAAQKTEELSVSSM